MKVEEFLFKTSLSFLISIIFQEYHKLLLLQVGLAENVNLSHEVEIVNGETILHKTIVDNPKLKKRKLTALMPTIKWPILLLKKRA